jgi:hypothetical protein
VAIEARRLVQPSASFPIAAIGAYDFSHDVAQPPGETP